MIKVAEIINHNDLSSALEMWHKIKQNLIPIQNKCDLSEWEMRESHPILYRSHIKRFDFLAMNRDLRNKSFGFSKWCRKVVSEDNWGYKPVAFYSGFPSKAKERCEANPDWPEFSKAWSMSNDIISKQMLC